MANDNKELILNTLWCKGCGICVAFCPRKVLEMKHEKAVIVDIKACIKCANCERRCPDYAIYVQEVDK